MLKFAIKAKTSEFRNSDLLNIDFVEMKKLCIGMSSYPRIFPDEGSFWELYIKEIRI